jgi:hypothetical protein
MVSVSVEVVKVAISCGSFEMTVLEGVGIRIVHEEFVIVVSVVLSHLGFSTGKFFTKYNIPLPSYPVYYYICIK